MDSSLVKRVYVEKKEGFNSEARRLREELADFLGKRYPELTELRNLRILRRYDVSRLDERQFEAVTAAVFSEPQCDRVFYGTEIPGREKGRCFGIEYAGGQYDQRADSAEQCAELVTGIRPLIKTADIYIFECPTLSDAALEGIKRYLINPVDSREADPALPASLDENGYVPSDVPVLEGLTGMDKQALELTLRKHGLAMSLEDLLFCQNQFKAEGRDPALTELKILDTYWSDHCRHTTFNTVLEEIRIDAPGEGAKTGGLGKALELYEKTLQEVYGEKAGSRKRTLMDIATLGAKALGKKGLIPDVDVSKEINACTIKVNAEFQDAGTEPWLLLFKNETHNHPTEIEPFGGAATCLGGAIRDPLSGRAFVHQAMRVTGGGDPRTSLADTLPGKLPQVKIAREASAGYSSYGNQIGLATGQVAEFYHPGFLAKRMELGAVIGAAPEASVRREEPVPGDAVILAGGRTGRDGIGGATGSSKMHTGDSVETAGAEVQKGNAVEERKLQRLFRNPDASRLIKRCNDFGAGGVSVAVGELAAGLDINLDKVTKKYAGLDGTELAISESQERMAVVTSASDAETFIRLAAAENLEAVIIARVSAGDDDEDKARLRMTWRGKTIADLSRTFLNTNGTSRSAKVLLKPAKPQGAAPSPSPSPADALDNLKQELASLRSCSRRGLQERFDGSIGAASVLFPWGGSEQGTPECGMAALLPSLEKKTLTASLMTFGYDPAVMAADPYEGAKGSIREALAKYGCLGGDYRKARLSLQEYFERPEDPESWGRPAAALLGALEAQLRLGIPAIGGKDSMSGNYRDKPRGIDLAVPPTLAAFAAGTVSANRVRSGALSGKPGNVVVLLGASGAGDDWDRFTTGMDALDALAEQGALKAAYPVLAGGIAATLAVMAFGNMTGLEVRASAFGLVNDMNYQGTALVEIDGERARNNEGPWVIAARILEEPVFRVVRENLAAETPLEVLRLAYEAPLTQVYPQTSTGTTAAEKPGEGPALRLPEINNLALKGEVCCSRKVLHSGSNTFLTALKGGVLDPSARIKNPGVSSGSGAAKRTHSAAHGAPLAVLPVFPGTNCEWDMERAFRDAGARTRQIVFRNRSQEDIRESIAELKAAIAEARIIAFSGGFSAGDEPDGSGKFIANVIRSPAIAGAVTELLEKRDGLILGICNGFQALIKTGLVPYGRILPMDETKPTLTFNTLGRHVSRMVRTRVMSCASPWLGLEKPGAVHILPVSHGEGRVVISEKEAEALFAAGQIPFCYADSKGNPTMAEPDNPNGSAFAIEGMTSPDGRVLGKMAHSERCGEYVHINIPGNKKQRIFEAGVRYFG
ncbi:MAG: phosphoribosylformylglycinamidine synthase [Treponema sp.]|jgi:phosphoribosylformylglycinamidine synthase|nr:phosphoribosylformylglycinamidine synthase [Treponema sp.]